MNIRKMQKEIEVTKGVGEGAGVNIMNIVPDSIDAVCITDASYDGETMTFMVIAEELPSIKRIQIRIEPEQIREMLTEYLDALKENELTDSE
jgi:hypothetical protein